MQYGIDLARYQPPLGCLFIIFTPYIVTSGFYKKMIDCKKTKLTVKNLIFFYE